MVCSQNPRASHKITWFERLNFGREIWGWIPWALRIEDDKTDSSRLIRDQPWFFFLGKMKKQYCSGVFLQQNYIASGNWHFLIKPPWYIYIYMWPQCGRWQCYSPRRKLSVLGLTWRINAPLIWWKDFFHSSFSLRIRPQCSCLKQVRCFGYFWIKSGMSKELWIKTCVFGSTFFSSGSTSDWFHSWGLLIWGHHFFSIHSFWGVLGL